MCDLNEVIKLFFLSIVCDNLLGSDWSEQHVAKSVSFVFCCAGIVYVLIKCGGMECFLIYCFP